MVDNTMDLWNNLSQRIYQLNRKKKEIFFDKVYSLLKIHKYKPVIHNYENETSKIYIQYIVDLFQITEEQAIILLNRFNGNVYLTIVFS